MVFCPNCGQQAKDGDVFCRECGTPLPKLADEVTSAPVAPEAPIAEQAAAVVEEVVAAVEEPLAGIADEVSEAVENAEEKIEEEVKTIVDEFKAPVIEETAPVEPAAPAAPAAPAFVRDTPPVPPIQQQPPQANAFNAQQAPYQPFNQAPPAYTPNPQMNTYQFGAYQNNQAVPDKANKSFLEKMFGGSNVVSKILKIFALFNVLAAIVVAIVLDNKLPSAIASEVAWIFIFCALVASMLIYAFGEHLYLLQGVKNAVDASKEKEKK